MIRFRQIDVPHEIVHSGEGFELPPAEGDGETPWTWAPFQMEIRRTPDPALQGTHIRLAVWERTL